MLKTDTRQGIRSTMALTGVALMSLQAFSGCALDPLESEEDVANEESVGQTGEALVCGGSTPVSAEASPGAVQSAALAVDGSASTRWESAWNIDDQYLTVDIGRTINLGGVTLNWEAACGKDYDIDVRAVPTDPWRNFLQIRGNTRSGPVTHEGTTPNGGYKTRYVRLHGISRCLPQYGYSLWDFTVHAPSTKCYTDSDGDGQGVAGTLFERCDACPAGSTSGGLVDCMDSNANVRRLQSSYFTTHRGDGSFDYNCNGVEDRKTVISLSGCTPESVYPNCVQATGVRPQVTCGTTVPLLGCAAMPATPFQSARCAAVPVNGPLQPCR